MNNLFVKSRSTKDIIISAVLLIGGVTMVALPTPASVNIAGLFLACTGIVLLAVLKSGWKNTETREKFYSKTLYFPREMEGKLKEAMEGSLKKITSDTSSQSSALKLDILYNKKTGKAFCQLSEYIPYQYHPFTEMIPKPVDEVLHLV
jgi:hypothetical protein